MRGLLRQYAAVLEALAQTEAILFKNNPVADYAEWLVAQTLGLELVPKSSKGFDALDNEDTKYEIKARRLTADNPSRQLSAIRSIEDQHFDYLAGVLFDHEFNVLRAAKIPWVVVNKLSTHRKHTNAAVHHLRDSVWDIPEVADLSELLQHTEADLS
ncbi:MAG: hypothetical protein AAGI53_16865 [Planctomycetota bacterium]